MTVELGKKLEWKRVEGTSSNTFAHRTIVDKAFEMPDGKIRHWGTIHPENSVNTNVIAFTPENLVVVAKQYRPGPEAVEIGLPGGMVEVLEGETQEEAAERRAEITALEELLQETGYAPEGEIIDLGTYHKDGYMSTLFAPFLMRDVVKVAEPIHTQDEFTEADVITVEELWYNATHDLLFDQGTVLHGLAHIIKINGGKLPF